MFEWSQVSIAFWALIIAIISLGWQIWEVIQKWISKPKVRIFNLEPFEIVYNNFGIQFNTPLLYRCEAKDAFIEKVEAILINTETQEKHKYEAAAVLEYRIDSNGQSSFPRYFIKEAFTPFIVSTKTPYKLAILFYDAKINAKITAELNKANEYIVDLSKKYGYTITDELVDTYNKSDLSSSFWSRATEELYLKPGDYELLITAQHESIIIKSTLKFRISEKDYSNLKLNAMIMATMHKEGQQLTYNTVFPEILN